MEPTQQSILSWDDIEEVASTPDAIPVNSSVPLDAQQMANTLTMANTILKNPTLGIVAGYLGHPAILLDGMPNMALVLEMKNKLDELIPTHKPSQVVRVICNHCDKVTTIDI